MAITSRDAERLLKEPDLSALTEREGNSLIVMARCPSPRLTILSKKNKLAIMENTPPETDFRRRGVGVVVGGAACSRLTSNLRPQGKRQMSAGLRICTTCTVSPAPLLRPSRCVRAAPRVTIAA